MTLCSDISIPYLGHICLQVGHDCVHICNHTFDSIVVAILKDAAHIMRITDADNYTFRGLPCRSNEMGILLFWAVSNDSRAGLIPTIWGTYTEQGA